MKLFKREFTLMSVEFNILLWIYGLASDICGLRDGNSLSLHVVIQFYPPNSRVKWVRVVRVGLFLYFRLMVWVCSCSGSCLFVWLS